MQGSLLFVHITQVLFSITLFKENSIFDTFIQVYDDFCPLYSLVPSHPPFSWWNPSPSKPSSFMHAPSLHPYLPSLPVPSVSVGRERDRKKGRLQTHGSLSVKSVVCMAMCGSVSIGTWATSWWLYHWGSDVSLPRLPFIVNGPSGRVRSSGRGRASGALLSLTKCWWIQSWSGLMTAAASFEGNSPVISRRHCSQMLQLSTLSWCCAFWRVLSLCIKHHLLQEASLMKAGSCANGHKKKRV